MSRRFNKEDKECIAVKIVLVLLFASTGSILIWEKNKTETEFDKFKYKLVYINGFVGLVLSPFNSLYYLYLQKYENDILLKG